MEEAGSSITSGNLQVYGKGGKLRAVPVTVTLADELKAWRKAQTAERLAAAWWDTDHDWMLSTDAGTR